MYHELGVFKMCVFWGDWGVVCLIIMSAMCTGW